MKNLKLLKNTLALTLTAIIIINSVPVNATEKQIEESKSPIETEYNQEAVLETETAVVDDWTIESESYIETEVVTESETIAADDISEINTCEIEEYECQGIEPFDIIADDIWGGQRNIQMFSDNGTSTFPEYYNIANEINLPIRDQQDTLECWAHTALACMEADLVANHLADTDINLSENHLAYFVRNTAIDLLGNDDNDTVVGSGKYYSYGGNSYRAGVRLMNWVGAALESNFADNRGTIENYMSGKTFDAVEGQTYDYILKDMYFIPTRDETVKNKTDAIKTAVANFGYVEWSYYDASTYHCDGLGNSGLKKYPYIYTYNPNYSSTKTNHSIVIVGWDDTISKDKFTINNNTPDDNGAWIVRNSWGTSSGDNGYFYISYYDKSIGQGNPATIFTADLASAYDNNYFHGNTTSIGHATYGTSFSEIFTAKKSENIDAVSFMISSGNADYTIKVYVNGNEITAASTSGKTSYAGIYTIPLEKSVPVNKWDNFKIELNFSDNTAIFYDTTEGSSSSTSYISQTNRTQAGESFNGTTDVSQDGRNYKINALTTNSENYNDISKLTPSFSPANGAVDEGNKISITTDNPAAVIRYTLDGTTPTTTYGDIYTTPIDISSYDTSVTLKAIAYIETDQSLCNSAEATFKYYVLKPVLNTTSQSLIVDNSFQLSISKMPTDSTTNDIIWSSSDTSIAEVDSTGKVTARQKGIAIITASIKDHNGTTQSATCNVNVTAILYKVTFLGPDGKILTTQMIEKGTKANYMPSLPEYTFNGWKGNDYKNVQKDLIVSGNWKYKDNDFVIKGIEPQTYTGKAITLNDLLVYNDGHLLTYGKDYKLAYSNNTNAGDGTARLTVTGLGKYSASKKLYFDIKPADIVNAEVGNTTLTYNNRNNTPNPTVIYNGITLTKNRHYTLEGTAATGITIVGKGNFTGRKKVDITVLNANEKLLNINSAKVELSAKTFDYDGTAHQPDISSITYKNVPLESTDYTIIGYFNNINAGTATVIITGKGKYNGSKTVRFTIKKRKLTENDVNVSGTEQSYAKGGVKPDIASALALNKDYKIGSYSNATKTGTATVAITGIGNYTGTVKKTYTITAKEINADNIDIIVPNIIQNSKGTNYKTTPTLIDKASGKALTNNVDYTFKCTKDLHITIIAKGKNYTGSYEADYKATVGLKSISSAAIKLTDKIYYAGTALTTDELSKHLLINKGNLSCGKEFTLKAAEGNPDYGVCTFWLVGNEDYGYTGIKKFTVKINQKKL